MLAYNKTENILFLKIIRSKKEGAMLIVNAAISLCSNFDTVVVINEDENILILSSGLAFVQNHSNIVCLCKPGEIKTVDKKISTS